MTDDPDAALVLECRAGSRRAFERLLARYERRHVFGSLGKLRLQDQPRLIFGVPFPDLEKQRLLLPADVQGYIDAAKASGVGKR